MKIHPVGAEVFSLQMDGWKGRQTYDAANSHFLQFCEHA